MNRSIKGFAILFSSMVVLLCFFPSAGISQAEPVEQISDQDSFKAAFNGARLFMENFVQPVSSAKFFADWANELIAWIPGVRAEIGQDPESFVIIDNSSGTRSTISLKSDAWRYDLVQAVWKTLQDHGHPLLNGRGFLEALTRTLARFDPYARILDPPTFRRKLRNIENEYVGIGIAWAMEKDGMRILDVAPGSPAKTAGVLPGDLVISIDGFTIIPEDIMGARSLLRGTEQTEVSLGILRQDSTEPLEILVVRKGVPLSSLAVNDMGGKILHVRVKQFSSHAIEELDRMIKKIWGRYGQRGGLILDLRFNPGGHLSSGYELADLFVSQGPLFRGDAASGPGALVGTADKEGTYRRLPLVLLVNERTASAAEVAASALRFHDRALLVGNRTLGKGIAQVTFELPGGYTLIVTALKIASAGGTAIQGYGVWPHVLIQDGDPYPVQALERRYLWVDANAAKNRPLLTLARSQIATIGSKMKSNNDATLGLAVEVLRYWNRHKKLTLLECARHLNNKDHEKIENP